MTNTPHTSPEAVERLALCRDERGNPILVPLWKGAYMRYEDHVENLRALSAALEVEKERSNKFMWQMRDTCKRAETAEAERDALKAELAQAVGVLQYVAEEDDAVIYCDEAATALTRAATKARAFLARHQKETGV